MFTIFATLSKDDLEYLYELTYKYGWIAAIEREEKWLPDPAYLAKAKIESEFKPFMDYALEEIENAYAVWLDFHEKPGWVKSMYEYYLESSLEDLLSDLDRWGITLDFYEIVANEIGNRTYLEQEGVEYLSEIYGEAFIENKLQMDIAELGDEEIVYYITNNDLKNDLINWLLDDWGWTLKEHLQEIYRPEDLEDAYKGLIEQNLEYLLEDAYVKYLNHFPGLEDEIEEIRRVKDEVIDQSLDAPLQDQIIAFQIALTTAHHHGSMADHILDVPSGEGKRILDKLSSDENVEKWNKDLAQVGIKVE